MYIYNSEDQTIIEQRAAQFRNQIARYLAGALTDDEFLPLGLQNGLYSQHQDLVLRIAVPNGLLNSKQLRKLAYISRSYDNHYCHITSHQNIEFHWPELKLEKIPGILTELAEVQMHSIQTGGNCITMAPADQLAGVAQDEIEDPRPWSEIIRQWSTLHPEFSFLPSSLNITVSGTETEEVRTETHIHDIGVQIVKDDQGQHKFNIFVGGDLSQIPVMGQIIREYLPQEDLLTYLDATLRIYNRYGNRDNAHETRIGALVCDWTPEVFSQEVEFEWEYTRKTSGQLTSEEITRVKSFFTAPDYETIDDATVSSELQILATDQPAFNQWLQRNIRAHKMPGYAVVTLSLKPTGVGSGTITEHQLDLVAEFADEYSLGELRTTHNHNLVLPNVKKSDLFALWRKTKVGGLATPKVGTLTDTSETSTHA